VYCEMGRMEVAVIMACCVCVCVCVCVCICDSLAGLRNARKSLGSYSQFSIRTQVGYQSDVTILLVHLVHSSEFSSLFSEFYKTYITLSCYMFLLHDNAKLPYLEAICLFNAVKTLNI
jgi:hypothetical protein